MSSQYSNQYGGPTTMEFDPGSGAESDSSSNSTKSEPRDIWWSHPNQARHMLFVNSWSDYEYNYAENSRADRVSRGHRHGSHGHGHGHEKQRLSSSAPGSSGQWCEEGNSNGQWPDLRSRMKNLAIS